MNFSPGWGPSLRQAESDPPGECRTLSSTLILALSLKAECGRRIRAVVKDTETQPNLAAWAADFAERKAGGIPKGEQDDLKPAGAGWRGRAGRQVLTGPCAAGDR